MIKGNFHEIEDTLPDKLSDLIVLAVNDCKKVEKLKTRKLDMYSYHYFRDGVCYVCMAGAVMDRTLKIAPKRCVHPVDFKGCISRKLRAIDSVRCGSLPSHAKYNKVRVGFMDIVLGNMGEARASWEAYLKAAALLKEHGL